MSECAKRGYASAHAAREASRKMTKRVKVYVCPDCHQFHLSASSVISRPDSWTHIRRARRG